MPTQVFFLVQTILSLYFHQSILRRQVCGTQVYLLKSKDNTSKKLARQKKDKLHTVCDKYGFVLKTVVTLGNVYNSAAFDEVLDCVTAHFSEAETIAANSAYKTLYILRMDGCSP